MKKGLDAYKKENYQKALKYFIDAQLEYPDNARIYYNIGKKIDRVIRKRKEITKKTVKKRKIVKRKDQGKTILQKKSREIKKIRKRD